MRRFTSLLAVLIASGLWCATALAQTKVTATHTCSKADPAHILPAGDSPAHSYGVEQFKCTFTNPMDLGGDKSKDAQATDIVEIRGDQVKLRGLFLVTMQSGDKAFLPYWGEATTKDGKPVSAKGGFQFVGGSGKLKGMQGKGTFECTGTEEGGWNCSLDGEYQPGSSAPAAASAAPATAPAAPAAPSAQPAPTAK